MQNGPRELELLFRAIVFYPLAPILLTDNDRQYHEVSVGASKLLGMPREKIIGHKLDDFTDPDFKPVIPERWNTFLKDGEQVGTIPLVDATGNPREVEYVAKGSILPVRHLLVLREKEPKTPVPSWVQDYALFLLDVEGQIVAWYAGAERIYGYTSNEIVGQNAALFYPDEHAFSKLQEKLKRGATEGHIGSEGWHVRKDGSRFWANSITMALKDEKGELQGFARVVRDLTDRHERDEKLRVDRARLRPIPAKLAIAGIVSGEFDRVTEANDAFLELVGYTREDLHAGLLNWPDLTPPEYAPLDELAHEEGLRFGACTPFEKEFIRKDGTRVPVLIATAVLKLCPFQWISFVQDLRNREPLESMEEDADHQPDFEEIVGTSTALKRVQRQVKLVAPTDATVLILGEPCRRRDLIRRSITTRLGAAVGGQD